MTSRSEEEIGRFTPKKLLTSAGPLAAMPAGPHLCVTATVPAHLSWDYDPSPRSRMLGLYERARKAQWDPATDIRWSATVAFGSPLPDDSSFAMASFEASPLAPWGRAMWDRFRWELQSWMVSQFLHGEQGALAASARLVETVPGLDAKYYLASQVVDEARHLEVFSRYLRDHVPDPYSPSASLVTLLEHALADSRWDVTALGMHIMIEALAMAAFRLADGTFHDDLIRQIIRLAARDEARHVSFGVLALGDLYRELSASERAEREEFVLEAAALIRRRFLLEDIWERLEISREDGRAYASHDVLMVKYRQAIFAKIVRSLDQIGLLTGRVRDGLARLDLLGFGSDRSLHTDFE